VAVSTVLEVKIAIPKEFAGLTLTPNDQLIMKFRDKSIFGRQSTDDLMFYVKRKKMIWWNGRWYLQSENWEFVVCFREILEDPVE